VRWFDRPIPLRWRHVLFLGNIKAISFYGVGAQLTNNACGREQLIALVFGTVLLSLLGQFVLGCETVATLTFRHIVSRLKNCKPN